MIVSELEIDEAVGRQTLGGDIRAGVWIVDLARYSGTPVDGRCSFGRGDGKRPQYVEGSIMVTIASDINANAGKRGSVDITGVWARGSGALAGEATRRDCSAASVRNYLQEWVTGGTMW